MDVTPRCDAWDAVDDLSPEFACRRGDFSLSFSFYFIFDFLFRDLDSSGPALRYACSSAGSWLQFVSVYMMV